MEARQKRCYLSDPIHPHYLSRRDNPPSSTCYTCGPVGEAFRGGDWHYYCDVCELVFHKNHCGIFLSGIRHPYHLEHLLNLTIRFETKTKTFNTQDEFYQSSKWDSNDFESDDGCDWCGKKLKAFFYRCLDCGFSLCPSCFTKDPPFTITTPKSHQHPLNLFPRPLSVSCNACGLDDKNKDKKEDMIRYEDEDEDEESGYVCLPCNYFVHKSCIDLPRVIKLTRHQHRLSLTPYLPPPVKRSCGVCQRNIDVKRGMYSCNRGCSYAIHSKCATHKDIWDGIDLEGVPEEPEEDLSPFVEVGKNLIKHSSHEHHLRFEEDPVLNYVATKECQACCRPIYSGGFYSCTLLHCDFFLHASCANFPKKKDHPVHKHPLNLQTTISNVIGRCRACDRAYSGFKYKCLNDSCKEYYKLFAMDVVCASVCEPFEHKVHPHPLFLFSGRDSSSLCGICCEEGKSIYTLRCNDCKFTICFKCATIPIVIHYKHDEHLLTLSAGEDSSGPYWCEKCEEQIDSKKWFYTCDQCCTTLHIDCVFDRFSYIKIGTPLRVYGYELTFASNYGNSRPFCDQCGLRCNNSGFFKGEDLCICSPNCIIEASGISRSKRKNNASYYSWSDFPFLF